LAGESSADPRLQGPRIGWWHDPPRPLPRPDHGSALARCDAL